MGFLGSVRQKLSRKDSLPASIKSSSSGTQGPSRLMAPPITASPSTRRPGITLTTPATTDREVPPPAYTAAPMPAGLSHSSVLSTPDDPYAFLSAFDTIFLIDDSGSMAGSSWRQTSAALRTILPICTAHDKDGVDVHFLNEPTSPTFMGLKQTADVERIFSRVRPRGGTPTGTRLHQILKPYLTKIERLGADAVKPINVIIVTDGCSSDDVESVIISAAKKLDKVDAPAWQVGIQFFQVGNEPGAANALKELDDDLAEMSGTDLRDMVDTVPWVGTGGGEGLNGEGILKVVLGAVTRKLDRKKDSREWRRA
ncbi:MAG: hypothetical protein M1817_001147 [Caeruleum heppii]|nr:MAG: hypothetical protein M1817_001147 [Caeruleum heppii]